MKTANSRQTSRKIIGLMSGTSCDGVDAALVEISGTGHDTSFKLLAFESIPYTSDIRNGICSLFRTDHPSTHDTTSMSFLLGEIFADTARQVVHAAELSFDDIDLIGSHGQTIYHDTSNRKREALERRCTLQIAEPSVIAARTGVTTVADFRPADVAAGGTGAPLVPYVDYILLRDAQKGRAVLNIGGIANLTIIPPSATLDDVIAFDTGPGNMIVDSLVDIITDGNEKYDRDGKLSAKGNVDKKFLVDLMSHPYFALSPPKSAGREQFGVEFTRQVYDSGKERNLSDEDILRTAVALTAQSIANALNASSCNLSELIVSGGGTHNHTLMQTLKDLLPEIQVCTSDQFGLPVDAKEAIAFAILANETIAGIPTNLPSATGAERRAVLGKIAPGKNYKKLFGIAE